jgi:hypothetical protein
MTVGNQDDAYCAYDDLLDLRRMESELIFGFISFSVENIEQYLDENGEVKDLNVPIFNLEINPKFILVSDYIQQSKKNNVETFKDKIKKKDFYSFFDLSQKTPEHIESAMSYLYGEYLTQEKSFEDEALYSNKVEDINII